MHTGWVVAQVLSGEGRRHKCGHCNPGTVRECMGQWGGVVYKWEWGKCCRLQGKGAEPHTVHIHIQVERGVCYL